MNFLLTTDHMPDRFVLGASTSLLAGSRPEVAVFFMPEARLGHCSHGGSPQAVTPGLVQQQVLAPATREPGLADRDHPAYRMPKFSRLFAEAVSDSIRDYYHQNRHLLTAGYWLIARSKRHPFIPARTYWTNAEPGNAENLLDRWPLPLLAGEIGGEVADPLDIFGVRMRREIEPRAGLTIEEEYSFLTADFRHAKLYRPDDPISKPDRRINHLSNKLPF